MTWLYTQNYISNIQYNSRVKKYIGLYIINYSFYFPRRETACKYKIRSSPNRLSVTIVISIFFHFFATVALWSLVGFVDNLAGKTLPDETPGHDQTRRFNDARVFHWTKSPLCEHEFANPWIQVSSLINENQDKIREIPMNGISQLMYRREFLCSLKFTY